LFPFFPFQPPSVWTTTRWLGGGFWVLFFLSFGGGGWERGCLGLVFWCGFVILLVEIFPLTSGPSPFPTFPTDAIRFQIPPIDDPLSRGRSVNGPVSSKYLPRFYIRRTWEFLFLPPPVLPEIFVPSHPSYMARLSSRGSITAGCSAFPSQGRFL